MTARPGLRGDACPHNDPKGRPAEEVCPIRDDTRLRSTSLPGREGRSANGARRRKCPDWAPAERARPSHRQERPIAKANEIVAMRRHHRVHVVVAERRLLRGHRAVATTDPPHRLAAREDR